MGSTATYRCKKCDLSAAVSGGADQGMWSATQTVWCGDCKALLDVASSVCDSRNYSGPEAVWRDVPLRCHHCNSEAVQRWHRELPCPSCGGKIDVDPMGGIVMWD